MESRCDIPFTQRLEQVSVICLQVIWLQNKMTFVFHVLLSLRFFHKSILSSLQTFKRHVSQAKIIIFILVPRYVLKDSYSCEMRMCGTVKCRPTLASRVHFDSIIISDWTDYKILLQREIGPMLF